MKKILCIILFLACIVIGCSNTPVVTMTGIEVSALPHKTNYRAGEILDLSGLEVIARYSDGTSNKVNDFYTNPANGSLLNNVGTHTVYVLYEDKKTSFDITVYSHTIMRVSIKSYPTKMDYLLGEEVDTTGLVLTIGYDDGSSEDITSGFIVSPRHLYSLGQQEIIITYECRSDRYFVRVYSTEECVVSFDTMGGSPTFLPQVVQAGDTVKKPEDPEKYGYVFKGWFTEYGNKWDFDNVVTTDMTLYAKWELASVYDYLNGVWDSSYARGKLDDIWHFTNEWSENKNGYRGIYESQDDEMTFYYIVIDTTIHFDIWPDLPFTNFTIVDKDTFTCNDSNHPNAGTITHKRIS